MRNVLPKNEKIRKSVSRYMHHSVIQRLEDMKRTLRKVVDER